MTALDPVLQAWIAEAAHTAGRGQPSPPPAPRVEVDVADVPAVKRPLPAWTERELQAVLNAQIAPEVGPPVRQWEDAVRRIVGLNRRDPLHAARSRTSGLLPARCLLVRWAAVLAVAAWRTRDIAMLDALLTLLDALDRPLLRAAALRATASDRELLRLARCVAEAQVRRLEVDS